MYDLMVCQSHLQFVLIFQMELLLLQFLQETMTCLAKELQCSLHLHHLDKLEAINSIYRVLKPGGRLVFKEPLADNPLLKIFRYFFLENLQINYYILP